MNERESLQQLISRGEGKTLEFKSAVPTPQHMARELAALANSGGGSILLGVREDGTIPGIFSSEAERVLRSALDLLKPQPEALLTTLPGPEGRTVGRIDVAHEPSGPVAAPDGLFMRSDARIEALPADVIQERALRTVATDLKSIVAPLASTLESLTQRMLELEGRIADTRKWRSRLPDILLGAGISALLGLVLALIFLK